MYIYIYIIFRKVCAYIILVSVWSASDCTLHIVQLIMMYIIQKKHLISLLSTLLSSLSILSMLSINIIYMIIASTWGLDWTVSLEAFYDQHLGSVTMAVTTCVDTLQHFTIRLNNYPVVRRELRSYGYSYSLLNGELRSYQEFPNHILDNSSLWFSSFCRDCFEILRPSSC